MLTVFNFKATFTTPLQTLCLLHFLSLPSHLDTSMTTAQVEVKLCVVGGAKVDRSLSWIVTTPMPPPPPHFLSDSPGHQHDYCTG